MSPALIRSARRFNTLEVVLLVTLAVGLTAWFTSGPRFFAENAIAKSSIERVVPPLKQANRAAPSETAVSPPSGVVALSPSFPVDVAARLKANGAGACSAQVAELAAGTMQGVARFNTVANWATADGDKRIVSVSIGQKYPDGAAVPFGLTSVTAAPNGRGTCDSQAVQVVPSPLPCSKLRETLASKSKQVGDLAGVALMQDASSQTMLIPAAANTCVLVGLRTAYAR